MTKIIDVYDCKYRSWTRNSYRDDEYGFEGTYTHKDLGIVDVYLSQDCNDNYYLVLNVFIDGIEYSRSIQLSNKCTHRYAGLRAKEYLEYLNNAKV